MTTLAEALAPKSDQLNADDLIAGPRVLKITGARIAKDGRDIKIVLNYEGDNGKPWKPCKTMGRAMVMAWKITEPDQFIGKSVRVFRDPTVRFGDQGEVGGIRISHMSDLERQAKVKLTVSQGKKGEFTFSPLVVEAAPAAFTIDDARTALNEAATLDDLRKVWSGARMRPFRGELQDVLDNRKAALEAGTSGNTDHGDNSDVLDLVAMFDAADTPAAIEAADKAANVLNLAADPDVCAARDRAWERGA